MNYLKFAICSFVLSLIGFESFCQQDSLIETVRLDVEKLNQVEINKDFFIGEWNGPNSKDLSKIIFYEGGFAKFIFGEEEFGGPEFEVNGKKGRMLYFLNSNVEPIQVDFVLQNVNTKEDSRVLGIIEILNRDNIFLVLHFGTKRPDKITKENSVHLIRANQKE